MLGAGAAVLGTSGPDDRVYSERYFSRSPSACPRTTDRCSAGCGPGSRAGRAACSTDRPPWRALEAPPDVGTCRSRVHRNRGKPPNRSTCDSYREPRRNCHGRTRADCSSRDRARNPSPRPTTGPPQDSAVGVSYPTIPFLSVGSYSGAGPGDWVRPFAAQRTSPRATYSQRDGAGLGPNRRHRPLGSTSARHPVESRKSSEPDHAAPPVPIAINGRENCVNFAGHSACNRAQ